MIKIAYIRQTDKGRELCVVLEGQEHSVLVYKITDRATINWAQKLLETISL